MEGAAVIIGEQVPTKAKGDVPRTTISRNNLLRPTTHYVPFGTGSLDIIGVIPFQIHQDINCDNGPKEIDNQGLIQDIASGFDAHLVQFLQEAA